MAEHFKQEILAALHSGQDHCRLLEIVRRHLGQGLKTEESYELLEQIWRELGFPDAEESTALRDDLEYLMESVWYRGARV